MMNEKSGAFTKRAYRESARIARCSFLLLLYSRASEERRKRAQKTSLDFLSLIRDTKSTNLVRFFLLRSYRNKRYGKRVGGRRRRSDLSLVFESDDLERWVTFCARARRDISTRARVALKKWRGIEIQNSFFFTLTPASVFFSRRYENKNYAPRSRFFRFFFGISSGISFKSALKKAPLVRREAHDSSDKTAFYLYDELVKSP